MLYVFWILFHVVADKDRGRTLHSGLERRLAIGEYGVFRSILLNLALAELW